MGSFIHVPWTAGWRFGFIPTKEGIVIFRADITGRKKQEQLSEEREAILRESQDRLRVATEAADIGTFDFYPQTGVLQFSDRSRELFGISPGPACRLTKLIWQVCTRTIGILLMKPFNRSDNREALVASILNIALSA